MIEYDFVPLHSVAHEIAPNVARFHAEMHTGDKYGCPNVDWETYLEASYAGQVVVVTARDNGKLVGYSAYTIGSNLRHKHITEATSNSIFIEKDYRGRVGIEILKRADQYLKSIGVQETSYITNDDSFGKLLSRNGYQTEYKVWSVNYGQ